MCGKIVNVDLKENKEIQMAIKEIVDHKSFSLSYEHVIKILEQAKVTEFATLEKTKIEYYKNSIKMRISNMNCIIDAVQKYKLN